jgi:hypothetical protein
MNVWLNPTKGSERRRILDDLVTVCPSTNHYDACALHDPNTSGWITRSEQWKSWIADDIGLRGIIPGAGKTVLASYIIEDVKAIAGKQSTCRGTKKKKNIKK